MPDRRIKFLTGAPSASHLDWQTDLLLDSFSQDFTLYLGLSEDTSADKASPVQSATVSNWRLLSSKPNAFFGTPTFSRQAHKTFHSPFHDAHQDFLTHSFAVLDNLQSSQIDQTADDSFQVEEEVTFMTTASILSGSPPSDSELSSLETTLVRPTGKQLMTISGPISNIKSLPSAGHLIALRPQTLTRNLIVGIIAIAPAKTVVLRRGNYEMDIVEMTVGDETKAGFTISTWLTPEQAGQSSTARETRRAMQRLKTGDVVAIERLALSVFRDQVFGQSLNWKTSKNVTTFSLIDKDAVEHVRATSKSQPVPSSIIDKVQRVREWVDSFIGPSRKRQLDDEMSRRGKKVARIAQLEEEYLPPDTQ